MKKTMEIEPVKTFHYFPQLPDDAQHYIFMYELPNIHNWHQNSGTLKILVEKTITLQLVCKKNKEQFSTKNIALLLNITKTNKDLFLFRAAHVGIPGLVQVAITQNPNLDFVYTTKNKKDCLLGCTPLSIAVRQNNYKSCLYLLHAGANVNKPEEDRAMQIMTHPNNYQPIHLVENEKILELLLEFKANINAQDNYGRTPIDLVAIDNTNSPITKALIKHGAIMPKTTWIEFKKRLKNW